MFICNYKRCNAKYNIFKTKRVRRPISGYGNSSILTAHLPWVSRSRAEMKRKQNHPYKIQVRGPLPADLTQRISALHTLAILKRVEKAAADDDLPSQRHDAAATLRRSNQV